MKTRKLTEDELLTIKWRTRLEFGGGISSTLGDEEIPVIEGLDSLILEKVKTNPETLSMRDWHRDPEAVLNDYGDEYCQDGEALTVYNSCDRQSVLERAGLDRSNANDVEIVAEAAASGHCGTSHCRAGWAIHLAGKQGYALEIKHGAEVAGAAIYLVSTGAIPDFYADDDEAMCSIIADAGVSHENP